MYHKILKPTKHKICEKKKTKKSCQKGPKYPEKQENAYILTKKAGIPAFSCKSILRGGIKLSKCLIYRYGCYYERPHIQTYKKVYSD